MDRCALHQTGPTDCQACYNALEVERDRYKAALEALEAKVKDCLESGGCVHGNSGPCPLRGTGIRG